MSKKDTTPEKRLAHYWDKRLGERSRFAALCENSKRMDPHRFTNDLQAVKRDIAEAIAIGQPLSRHEYLLSLLFGFLLPPNDMPYEQFFRKRWHETKTHLGYGPIASCDTCRLERREARKTHSQKQGLKHG